MKKRCSLTALAILVSGALSAMSASAADADNWPEYHRDFKGWRYSPLEAINKSNVKKLKVAWIHQTGDIQQGLQATPIIVDGIIYYSGSNNRVFAVDAATGKELWKYYTELDSVQQKSVFGFYNRGVTVGRGKVYIGSSDGRVIALDQKTGKELWKVQLTDPKSCHGCNFTSSPQLAGDVLIAGPTGGELAQHGKIYALNADTGARAWALEVLKNDQASWPGDSAKTGGGGAWLPGQYDPNTGLYYIGTSNPAPNFNVSERKGDNLYTSTVLALEPKTGKIAWFHQEVPNDAWDFDSPYEFIMVDKAGEKVMAHLNKGGFVTVYDRKSGKIINVWQLAENANWVKSIDPKTGALIGRNEPEQGKNKNFCPSALGARSWNPGAYSPKTGLWYTNAYELCNRITMGKQEVKDLAFSQPYFGMTEFDFSTPPGGKAVSRLAAYDPLTGKRAWKIEYDLPGLGGVLTTAGGLVFNGDSHGYVHAYDDQTGKELWNFNTGSGIRGGIVSYAAGGKQYILVPSGFGSLFPGFASSVWPEFKDVRGASTLVAFSLE